MKNELLKEALMRAHKTVEDVAQATGVDPKTVYRWLSGRVPHARHRWSIAQLLDMREDDLWELREQPKQPSLEIIMPYAHRIDQPPLRVIAEPQITPMAYNTTFLPPVEMLIKSRRQVLRA